MVESDINCSLDDVTKNVKEKAYIIFKGALIHLYILCYIFDTTITFLTQAIFQINSNFQIFHSRDNHTK